MNRPRGIVVAAFLMILFGLAEVATGITGNFLNVISATPTSTYTLVSSLIGSFYCFAGVLILTMRRWGAVLAIVLLVADIIGRIADGRDWTLSFQRDRCSIDRCRYCNCSCLRNLHLVENGSIQKMKVPL